MEKKETRIHTHLDALKHFIETMDIEMIDAFLGNNKEYNHMERYEFISELQKTFEDFKKKGDTALIHVAGKCQGCYKKDAHPGFSFYGNKSRIYFSLIFITKKKKVVDIQECVFFRNSKYKLNLSKKIYLG